MDVAGGPVRLFERATLWFRERNVLLPGVPTLTRLVSEARAGANDRLYSMLADAAGPVLIKDLEDLLRVEDGTLATWERLRTGYSRVSVPESLGKPTGAVVFISVLLCTERPISEVPFTNKRASDP